jgi:hypothetical protein
MRPKRGCVAALLKFDLFDANLLSNGNSLGTTVPRYGLTSTGKVRLLIGSRATLTLTDY